LPCCSSGADLLIQNRKFLFKCARWSKASSLEAHKTHVIEGKLNYYINHSYTPLQPLTKAAIEITFMKSTLEAVPPCSGLARLLIMSQNLKYTDSAVWVKIPDLVQNRRQNVARSSVTNQGIKGFHRKLAIILMSSSCKA
jgi:hypothetical protein